MVLFFCLKKKQLKEPPDRMTILRNDIELICFKSANKRNVISIMIRFPFIFVIIWDQFKKINYLLVANFAYILFFYRPPFPFFSLFNYARNTKCSSAITRNFSPWQSDFKYFFEFDLFSQICLHEGVINQWINLQTNLKRRKK